jgi:hypothetical protein
VLTRGLKSALPLILALAVGTGAGIYLLQRPTTATPAQDFGDAVAALENAGSETVAVVNGTPISMSKVKAYTVFKSTGRQLGDSRPDKSIREYVDSLISDELLYQEAQRRGLIPEDDAVKAMASQTKTGLLELMKQDTEAARGLREIFDQVKGTPYSIDVYDSSPAMLDSFRHVMAIGAARTSIGDELDASERQDRGKRDERVKRFVEDLRSSADVKVAALPK